MAGFEIHQQHGFSRCQRNDVSNHRRIRTLDGCGRLDLRFTGKPSGRIDSPEKETCGFGGGRIQCVTLGNADQGFSIARRRDCAKFS